MNERTIRAGVVSLIRTAETTIPSDVVTALEKAFRRETGIAKLQVENILASIELAKKTGRPICQDTGVQTFFVEVGTECTFISRLDRWIRAGAADAVEKVPLRPNSVDPLSRRTDGGVQPIIYWSFIAGDGARITALPKGSGSENMSKLAMLDPCVGVEGVKDWVVRSMADAGGRPCPPTVVGIGIGGDAGRVMRLAKSALLRPIGTRHERRKEASLEKSVLRSLNATGIGPMGLGGKTTVLDVHVQTAPCHPASLPVGLVVQCWAHRKAQLTIASDGSVEVVSL
jgi:fumarate hydratase subunit alpha